MSLPYDPTSIASDEVVTHFLLSKSDFSIEKRRVKHRALEPTKSESSISVFRVHSLDETKIWEIGQTHVASAEHSIRARADLLVSNILAAQLKITPEEPPIRHANVSGWPTEKNAMMAIALELAAEAVLRLPEDQ